MHGVGSRNKLRPSHARLYPGDSVLDELGRALCEVGCLPRKELHEAWELSALVRQRFRGGHVVDLCAGYGLVAQLMVLMDDSCSGAVAVDVRLPPNHRKVHEALAARFPSLRGRVRFQQAPLRTVALSPEDIVVSSHACGGLSDDVLALAGDAGARVAVLPCCHAWRRRADLATLTDPAAAMDAERAERLRRRGYQVHTLSIPEQVTPRNRVILGAPDARG